MQRKERNIIPVLTEGYGNVTKVAVNADRMFNCGWGQMIKKPERLLLLDNFEVQPIASHAFVYSSTYDIL